MTHAQRVAISEAVRQAAKSALARAGTTQRELARVADISEVQLSRFLSETGKLSQDSIDKLGRALGLSVVEEDR